MAQARVLRVLCCVIAFPGFCSIGSSSVTISFLLQIYFLAVQGLQMEVNILDLSKTLPLSVAGKPS